MLASVWHIPQPSRNLFSVKRFTKDIGPVTSEQDECVARAKDFVKNLAREKANNCLSWA